MSVPKFEQVLLALAARLETLATATRHVDRGQGEAPGAIPPDGLVNLIDGVASVPEDEELLGDAGPYFIRHETEIRLFVTGAGLDAAFASLALDVAAALEGDLTLGGLVMRLHFGPPQQIADEALEFSDDMKAGAIPVILEYQQPTRI